MRSLRDYCLSKRHAVEDFPFGPEPMVMKVSSKIFALVSVSGGRGSISLKCDPFLAEQFRQQYSSVTPGYHLNKRHWNTIVIDGSIPENELLWMIDHSYGLVVKGLTKSQREALEAIE